MRDHHDQVTLELPVGNVPKKRGRKPLGLVARDAATRKREQRARQAAAIVERSANSWTEAECLAVLMGTRWRGTETDQAAWLQLGRLRGFVAGERAEAAQS
ncbi:hypothetical protein [Parachitinimonas caeni]|uniref:Uncharacterized protein n=1 Tax=Parachitinimonas caeni TaxID=3031301 RepID=A0ABT7E3V9_9NEIS|nr:hypothetical protein [Parachitinimonas caeni]MDK2126988.1 hypothetical protein [Parachitinimonas caeni]